MASGRHRKRLEVSEELYYEIERLAIWLHMPVAKCAEMLLWDAVNRTEHPPKMPALRFQAVAEGNSDAR